MRFLKYIIEKIDASKINPENSSTTKVSKNIPSSFSISTIYSLSSIKTSMMYTEGKIVWNSFVNY